MTGIKKALIHTYVSAPFSMAFYELFFCIGTENVLDCTNMKCKAAGGYGTMEVQAITPRGYCKGVVRAIDMARKARNALKNFRAAATR